MRKRENMIAVALGGTMVLAVLVLLFATHYRALIPPRAQIEAAAETPALNIPTIDEMCAALGAAGETLEQCKSDEGAAAEFVIAWMALHGFVANGTIDLAQIVLSASLGPDPFSPLAEPDLSLTDPSLLTGDPAIDALAAEPSLDAGLGLPGEDTLESHGQVALFCMSSSTDWVQMQSCISERDPSTRFSGP